MPRRRTLAEETLEREEQEIRGYVLSQSPRRERVTHAEKITTRRIYVIESQVCCALSA